MAVPAGAITYGTEDRANTYSNVGSILVQRADGSYAQFCTGTLVAPGVFLTAAHCTSYLEEQGLEARTFITFSPNLHEASILPIVDLVTHPSYDPHQVYRYDGPWCSSIPPAPRISSRRSCRRSGFSTG